MTFSYRDQVFALDERGLQTAYLCFLMNEDPNHFYQWHKNHLLDYPDSIAWAVWKGFLTIKNKMILKGNI